MICCAAVEGILEGCGGKIGRLNGGGGNCPEVREKKMGELVLVGKRVGMGARESKRTRSTCLRAQLSSRSLHNPSLLLTILCVVISGIIGIYTYIKASDMQR